MTPQQLAQTIQQTSNITLATVHASGNVDNANAQQNIIDTANGSQAQRSSYADGKLPPAPGGTVELNQNMLQGMLDLAGTYAFRVSEIAGGCHSANSPHYDGDAFDVDQINGNAVNSGNPDYQAFMTLATQKGAYQVLDPGLLIMIRMCTLRMLQDLDDLPGNARLARYVKAAESNSA